MTKQKQAAVVQRISDFLFSTRPQLNSVIVLQTLSTSRIKNNQIEREALFACTYIFSIIEPHLDEVFICENKQQHSGHSKPYRVHCPPTGLFLFIA